MVNIHAQWVDGAWAVDERDLYLEPVPAGARIRFVSEVDEAEINQVDLEQIKRIYPNAHDIKIEMRPRLSTAARTAEIIEARTVPDKLVLWSKAKGHEDKTPSLLACHAELTGENVAYSGDKADGEETQPQEPNPEAAERQPEAPEAAAEAVSSQPTAEQIASYSPLTAGAEIRPGIFLSRKETEQQALSLKF